MFSLPALFSSATEGMGTPLSMVSSLLADDDVTSEKKTEKLYVKTNCLVTCYGNLENH